MTYEQQWQVLSGDIPWVTVGLPNSKFSIESYAQNASQVSPENSSGFTGVRVDLDEDYQAGQTFSIKFTVLQSNLLERLTQESKWRINYTPGWYDRATIDHLQINLVSPVDYQTYSSVSPMPGSVSNNVITWEKSNLSAGSRFNIIVECTDGSFLTATDGMTEQGGTSRWVILGAVIAVAFVIFMIVLAVRRSRQTRDEALKARIAATEKAMAEDAAKKEEVEKGFREYVIEEKIEPDEQGRYYDRGYGDYITPAIWAAVIMGQQKQQNTPAPARSCACACVSCACACACACAGGGAAGCAKKSLHECQNCVGKKEI